MLSHRVIYPDGVEGPWQQTLTPPRRHVGMWGLHAAGNLYLAYQSLVEQLAAQLEDPDDFSDLSRSVSYQLVQAVVVQQLGSQGGQYQFRLIDGQTATPLWVSPVHAL